MAALRTNPIAAPYFAGIVSGSVLSEELEARALARIHAMVSRAVDHLFVARGDSRAVEHAKRQRAIIERCDLKDESHSKVASDLGLSRREFYRERKRARERLGEYLARFQQRTDFQRFDEFGLMLASADGLCRIGRHDVVIASMEKLRSQASEPGQCIRANVALAGAYCDVGAVREASDALRSARAVCERCESDCEEGWRLNVEIDIADAWIRWMLGKTAEVEARLSSVGASIRSPSRVRTEAVIELDALTLMRVAMLRREIGDTPASLALLRQAAALIHSLSKVPPSLKIELLANLSLTQMLVWEGGAAALESMERYLEFSQEHNMLADTAAALTSLATLHLQWNQTKVARAFARSGLNLAHAIGSKSMIAELTVINARVETQDGNPKAALAMVARVRPDLVPGSYHWALSEMIEAEALVRAGAYQTAWRIANETAELMSALGMGRYAGAALRIAAEAAEGANRRGDALHAITDAIALLETRGHASSLALAYACSARLTNSKRDASRARELFEHLRPPQGSFESRIVPRLVPSEGAPLESF